MAEPAVGRRRNPQSRQPARRLDVLVDEIGPPISSVLFAPEVVTQRLEILTIALRHGKLIWLKPIHASSLQIGLPRSAQPSQVVLEALAWYPLAPRVVHSTSWRYASGSVVLTYVAVVDPPVNLPPGSLEDVVIERTELARGSSLAPPDAISVAAVLEHALRHLSWLIRDDPAIAAALATWVEVLADYQPEPFRALA
jgi:hypothetical protein